MITANQDEPMNDSTPSHTPRLGWSAAGWFGGSLGAIGWFVYAAATTFSQNLPAAILLLSLFIGPLMLSLLLWRQRHSTPILRALTIMLTVDFLAVAAGFYVLYHYQVRGFINVSHFPTKVFIALPILYVVLLWRFHILSKSSRKPTHLPSVDTRLPESK
jgi:hypothetical protein